MHQPVALASSTGLSPRLAAALSYAGWWLTGIVFYVLERDPFARFHAAQAIAAFGAIAVFIVAFLGLAAASLSFMPAAFSAVRLGGRADLGRRTGAVAGRDVESGERERLAYPDRRRSCRSPGLTRHLGPQSPGQLQILGTSFGLMSPLACVKL